MNNYHETPPDNDNHHPPMIIKFALALALGYLIGRKYSLAEIVAAFKIK